MNAVVANLPQEHIEDYWTLIDLWPTTGLNALVAEIKALLEGMHGAPVDRNVMGQAIRDYVAAFPKQPSLKHFRGFVRGVEHEDDRKQRRFNPRGMTGAASVLIDMIRKKRHPQFPQSIPPNWGEGISERVQGVIKPFLTRIFTDDPKGEGTLLAQMARAMEEAAE